MAELLITSSIDPIEEGRVFENGVLPRHVTIWQQFMLPDVSLGSFEQEVGQAVEGFAPLEVLGAERALFGPNDDVPVRRVHVLGSGATLITMHAVLGEIINRHDGQVRNPEWAYENFNPHVTYVDDEALFEYQYVALNTVELVEKQSTGAKMIRKLWELEEA